MRVREWCPHCEEVTECKTKRNKVAAYRLGKQLVTSTKPYPANYECTKCGGRF